MTHEPDGYGILPNGDMIPYVTREVRQVEPQSLLSKTGDFLESAAQGCAGLMEMIGETVIGDMDKPRGRS